MTTAILESTMVLTEKLKPSPFNPRKTFDKQRFEELKASIKGKGILIPLLIRDIGDAGLQIIAGEQRWRAAQALGIKDIPVIVRELDDAEAREIALIDNLQRTDLHPLDEADAYQTWLGHSKDLSIADIAAKVGKSEGYVRQRLALRNLVPALVKAFQAGQISYGVAFLCARQLSDHQKDLVKNRLGHQVNGFEDLTVQSVADYFQRNFHLDLSKTIFDTTSKDLVPAAGSCVDCPKRTGNNAALFPDIKKKDLCTDANCFHDKERAFIKIQVGTHKDAVLLTVGQSYNQKPKGTTEWRATGSKPCKHSKQGVVVERLGHYSPTGQDFPSGTVLDVCLNPRCPEHFGNGNGSSSGRGGRLTDEEKKKRVKHKQQWQLDQAIHDAMIDKLRDDANIVGNAELRRLALEIAEDNGFKYRAAWLAQAFGFEPKGDTPYQKNEDARKLLIKHLDNEKTGRADLLAFLACTPLTPTSDLDESGRKLMRQAASDFGIKAEVIEKALKVERDAKKAEKKPKTKTTKK